jgi:site-specific recombinase XerD
MHLLQSGNPVVVIRDFLGHSDIQSTQIYAKADLDMKRRALEKASQLPERKRTRSWQRNPDLLEWLESL